MNNANENKQINQTEIKDARTVFKIMKKCIDWIVILDTIILQYIYKKRNVWQKVSHAIAEIKHTTHENAWPLFP